MTDPSIPLQYKGVQLPNFANIFAQGQQLQLQRQAAAREQESHAQQMQLGAQQIQQNQNSIDTTAATNKAYSDALSIGPDGTPSVDSGKLTQALAQSGHGAAIPTVMKNITDFQKSQQDLLKTKGEVGVQQSDMAGSIGAAVKAANYDPSLLLSMGQHAIQAGTISTADAGGSLDHLQQFLQAGDMASATQLSKQLADTLITHSPAQQKLANEATTAAAETSRAGSAAAEAQNSTTKLNAELPGVKADAQLKQLKVQAYQQLTGGDPSALQHYVAGSIDPKKYPTLYTSTLNQAQHATSIDDIAGIVAKGAQNVAEQERQIAVETDPKVTGARLAQSEAQASFQHALTQGDTAHAKYFESMSGLQDSLATAQTIGKVVELSKSGNAVAGAQLKAMVPEFTNAVQSIKRMAATQGDKGLASTADHLSSEVSSLFQGKPLSESVLKEIGPYVQTIANGATANHNATVKALQATYPAAAKDFKEEAMPYASTAPKGGAVAPLTATGPNGHKISSADGGKTWVDAATGAPVK